MYDLAKTVPAYEFLHHLSVQLLPFSLDDSVFFGTESIMNLEAKLWNMVPQNYSPNMV